MSHISVADLESKLLARMSQLESCVIAFSAGVDSTVVSMAAYKALGNNCLAVTGNSLSMASGELDEACRLAKLIGIRHEVVSTQEFSQPSYLQNDSNRCYHCKTELYSQLEKSLGQWNVKYIVNGANLDDVGDYRPGMQAATERKVISPLIDCGFRKEQIRLLAKHWNLPIWDKPATPCLSSRIAYGEEVTAERLHMIDQAEVYLRSLGLRELRVRYHKGDIARLELPLTALTEFLQEPFRTQLVSHLHKLGFKFITLDLEGYRSGSLNQLVELNLS